MEPNNHQSLRRRSKSARLGLSDYLPPSRSPAYAQEHAAISSTLKAAALSTELRGQSGCLLSVELIPACS